MQGPTLLSSEILDEINAKADALQKWRKKRPPIDGLRKPADIGAFDEKHSGGVEGKAVQVMRTELSDEVEEENQRVVIGCDDGYCRILSSDGKIEKQFKAHKKAVTGLAMSTSMDVILSGGADSDAIVWRENSGKYQKKATLKAHSKSEQFCAESHVCFVCERACAMNQIAVVLTGPSFDGLFSVRCECMFHAPHAKTLCHCVVGFDVGDARPGNRQNLDTSVRP